ncbi:MAG: VWA domain-containing protein [Opitutaceae bacterium]|nr:VWA domain-containing protein [Opitutaceae bacterium]
MNFHWPHLLWLLVPVVILAVLDAVRRGRGESARNWPKILRAWAGARQAAVGDGHHHTRGRLLLWLGLALGVVALARPQWGRIEEPVFDQSREIVIALDLSRSMLAPDVRPSRLERARLLIQGLLDGLRGERVGLVVFAGTAFLQVPLSADYEVLNEFLPALNPAYMPVVGTDYEAMLRAVLDAFGDGGTADRYLIVLSDGESQTDTWRDLVADFRRKNIRVLGLGVGTAEGTFIPDQSGGYVKDERGAVVLSKLNSSTLQELAAATNGVYTDASTWVDLGALLKQTIAAGQRGEFKERVEVRQIERFQWALAPTLLCLLLSLWREFPVRPRVRSLPLAAPAARKSQISSSKLHGAEGAAALILLALLFGLRFPPSAIGAEDTSVYAAPLSKLVERLSAQPALSAGDYAALARETVTWGQRLQQAGQAVTPGPVNDALAGVAAGEKLDAKAVDWAQLRGDLGELLRKPPEPPPQSQPPPKQDQQQKKEQQQQAPPQSSGGGSQNQPQEKQESQSPPEPPPTQNSEPKTQNRPPPPPPKPSEQANTGETQKIGGQAQSPSDAKSDPSLVLPIQKLDQLRNQDSPAELFQMLDSRNSKPSPKKGRDW